MSVWNLSWIHMHVHLGYRSTFWTLGGISIAIQACQPDHRRRSWGWWWRILTMNPLVSLSPSIHSLSGLVYGTIYRKTSYFMEKKQWFPVKISLKPIQSSNDSRAFAYHFSWSFLILPPSFLHLQLGKAPGAQSHLGDQSPWIFEHAGELQGKPQCLQCLYIYVYINYIMSLLTIMNLLHTHTPFWGSIIIWMDAFSVKASPLSMHRGCDYSCGFGFNMYKPSDLFFSCIGWLNINGHIWTHTG